jgi:hypothetical protein
MAASNIINKVSGVEIEREGFIEILNRATKSGNFRFIRQICDLWLTKYPNDLAVQCFLTRSMIFENDYKKSIELINNICERDPEYLPAWELLARISSKKDNNNFIKANAYLFALGKSISTDEIPLWGKALKEIRECLDDEKYDMAEYKIQPLLKEKSSSPIIEIYHLRLAKKTQDESSFNQLTKIYHQRWPRCIQISLYLAESLMEQGEETESVALFHNCAIDDPSGDVVRRMWGNQNDFISIWPQKLTIVLDIPLPSQIAVPLDRNQLTAGENYDSNKMSSEKESDRILPVIEIIKSKLKNILHRLEDQTNLEKKTIPQKDITDQNNIEEELSTIAHESKKSEQKNENRKIPVYVTLATKRGLTNKYGEKSTAVICNEIKTLTDVLNLRSGWRSVEFYPDDINCMRMFELDAVIDIDPWKIKLALVDLDKYLEKKGQMIGCVLIIGGGEVIPFHSLPNPTDDKDSEILSDNPYSTLDGNYFVPEWPVGRLPGEESNDPGLLLKQIRLTIKSHRDNIQITPWWQMILDWILHWGNIQSLFKGIMDKPQNYGYTASVWRRSSLAAFRPIGGGNNLRVSPPFVNTTLDIELLKKSKFAYFNLHGLPETPDWYGQRDVSEQQSGPDFPIAISAQQMQMSESSPEMIFSEACYGAYIKNKNADESIALMFKDIGSSIFIGSTGISYGSVYTPLIGADLLAFLFWKFILEGYTAGEAFMRAKVNLAEVMMQRQGYLDGEDQKTLLSFVLYGDPLVQPEGKTITMKMPSQRRKLIKINTVNDNNGIDRKEPRLSGEILNNVKNILKEYLPGIENAEVNIRHHQIPYASINSKYGLNGKSSDISNNRVMISYCRPILVQTNTHYQYARVTLDNAGKMIKLAVSR